MAGTGFATKRKRIEFQRERLGGEIHDSIRREQSGERTEVINSIPSEVGRGSILAGEGTAPQRLLDFSANCHEILLECYRLASSFFVPRPPPTFPDIR